MDMVVAGFETTMVLEHPSHVLALISENKTLQEKCWTNPILMKTISGW